MRRALACCMLGLALWAVPGAAWPAPPTTAPTTSSRATAPPRATGGGLTSGGEGFPWVPTGVVALAAGLIGWRLRRSARGG